MNNADIERKWYLIDAEGKVLGRLATEIAGHLRGKNKVDFRRHNDVGDMVVVINAAKIVVTGNKANTKSYIHHTGWPTGLRTMPYSVLKDTDPSKIIYNAVNGMLPKTLQRDVWLKRLHIYADSNHPHAANFGKVEKAKDNK
ncbi:MAG: 50S ribosomal protein L13 [Patescibacteria group bacterium]|jgi:large subunit ribosomal protein L13